MEIILDKDKFQSNYVIIWSNTEKKPYQIINKFYFWMDDDDSLEDALKMVLDYIDGMCIYPGDRFEIHKVRFGNTIVGG